MIADADLLIDIHVELKRQPDKTGVALLKEYHRAIKEFTGTHYSTSRVAETARRLRKWLAEKAKQRTEFAVSEDARSGVNESR